MAQVDSYRSKPLERISTGIDALDSVLAGGIPRYSIVFVAGPPGTGKTVLCQQMLFANARTATSVMYLGTLSESVLKMTRYVQGFRFFQADLLGDRVIYGDLGSALKRDSGEALLEEMDRLIRLHRPEFLVIDSFKVVREYFDTVSTFREFTSALMTRLAAWEVTAVFVGEYAHDDIWEQPEFGIADGIIYLYGTEEPSRQKRFLRVMKMRGTDYFSGQHYFEITPGDIELYPRMDPSVVGEYSVPSGRVGSAIEGFTGMLGGGLFDSTSALFIGGAGTGKTITMLSFLVEGAREGKPGLMVSFEESADQIVRNARAFDWDLEGLIEQGLIGVLHVSPSELDIDRHAAAIKQAADRIKAQRVVIDTITAIEASSLDQGKFQGYLWAIVDYFKRTGVTIILGYESAAQTELRQSSGQHLSFLSDVIVNLKLVEVDGAYRRTINVLKLRGSGHDNSIRELIIEPPRLAIGNVFDPPNGKA